MDVRPQEEAHKSKVGYVEPLRLQGKADTWDRNREFFHGSFASSVDMRSLEQAQKSKAGSIKPLWLQERGTETVSFAWFLYNENTARREGKRPTHLPSVLC